MRISTKQKQLQSTLASFYNNPVARVSLEVFLSLGLVIFLGAFAVQPTLVTMSDLIQEIEEKREISQQLTQKVAALSTAQSEFAALGTQLTLLDEAVPSDPQVIKTLKIIEKLATENTVIITGLSLPQVPEPNASASAALKQESLPIQVAVTGDYASIRQFAEALLSTRRLLHIETINFSLNEKRGSRTLSATIQLSAPYYQ
ncbi:MAG: type 4a pilus biogenesis protein PilO [bacterium]|nr:type 4a pilus biogenesis protein PilO [bacterium]